MYVAHNAFYLACILCGCNMSTGFLYKYMDMVNVSKAVYVLLLCHRVCTGMYWCVLLCMCMYWCVLVCTGVYVYALVCTGVYVYVCVCMSVCMYWYVLVCMCVCVCVCLLQHRARAALSTHNWKPERAMEHLIS